MYLGVHTPLDVGVAFLLAGALVFALWRCYRDEESFRRAERFVLAAMLLLALAYAVWVNLMRFPADVDADNLFHGVKNGWSLLGAVLGLVVSYLYDEKRLHFSVKAPLPGQICKVVLGLALLLGLRAGLKALFAALAGGALWTNCPRYCLTVIFAGCVWPLTFPRFAGIGEKKT